MLLKYRGVNYKTASSNVDVTEEVIGRYRGATATRQVTAHANSAPVEGLIYRGAVVR